MVDNRYRVNAASVFSLKYHLAWCPKYRKRILTNALEKRLRELLYQKAKEIKGTIHTLEIMPDHVRMFVESDPTMAPARLAAQFKGFTSHQLREEFPWLKSYLPSLWSRSYYIGSIGAVSEVTVGRYVANQKSHA
jgi:putative transposase